MSKKKLAIIILLVMTFSMILLLLCPALTLSQEDNKQKAETLLNLLYTVHNKTDEAMIRLETQNISIPETVNIKYNEGVESIEEASNLMNHGKYSEVNTKVINGMQSFEEALRFLQNVSTIIPNQSEVTAEKIITLKDSLIRSSDYIKRLENLTRKAKANGYDTGIVDIRISQIKQLLTEARNNLINGDLLGANEELLKVNVKIKELQNLLDSLVNLIKISNMEKYVEETEIRVSTIKENITLSTSLSPQIKEEAITALNNSETSISKAREYIEESKIEEAINEIQEARKWEDESTRILASITTQSNSVETQTDNLATTENVLSN